MEISVATTTLSQGKSAILTITCTFYAHKSCTVTCSSFVRGVSLINNKIEADLQCLLELQNWSMYPICIRLNSLMTWINTLVMDPKRITLLKSLSKSFMRQDMEDESQHSEPWSADYVKEKGNSQIFLLHGRPGVGKTYTAGVFPSTM